MSSTSVMTTIYHTALTDATTATNNTTTIYVAYPIVIIRSCNITIMSYTTIIDNITVIVINCLNDITNLDSFIYSSNAKIINIANMQNKIDPMFHNSIVLLYNTFSRFTIDVTSNETTPPNTDDDVGIYVNIIIRCKNDGNLESFISLNNTIILRKASIQNKTDPTLNNSVRFL